MSMRSFFCLFPTTHPSLSLLKIQQDMTQSELSQLIAALRAETYAQRLSRTPFRLTPSVPSLKRWSRE